MTDFSERLQRKVDELGQAEVARRMGCSAATIHQLRTRQYPAGTVDRWQREFDAIFAPGMVDCPVLGPITPDVCAFHRKRPFAATNPTRVRLWQTCRICPNNPNAQTDE